MHPSSLAPPWRSACRSLVATLVFATSLVAAFTVGTDRATAATDPHSFADPIFSANARGDITTIGNVSSTCDHDRTAWRTPGQGSGHDVACLASTVGAAVIHGPGPTYETNPPPRNNDFSMIPVDVDADASTSSSSRARLEIPAGSSVLYAGLHWNAAYGVEGFNNTVSGDELERRFTMKLKAPGGAYAAIAADDTWEVPTGTKTYAGYADVTDLVGAAGTGDYWGADVVSCTGFGGCFGSWSLTVAYAHPDAPARNLNVWHGWQRTPVGGEQVNTVNGITPPPHGDVSARIGVVNADGDRGYPDTFEISSPSHPAWKTFATADRPFAAQDGDDWFNSTTNYFGARRTAAQATPNFVLNLNHDIALVEDDDIIDNDDTSFSFRTKSEPGSGESIYNQVVHSAVEIYAPEIQIDKTVAPEGPVTSGDEVRWTLKVRNVGIDPIRNATVTDPLPDGVELVEGSIEVTDGPADEVGARTAAIGDDEADWDGDSRTLTVRIGAGADATHGGTMAVAPAGDGSDEVVITFRTKVVAPPDAKVTNVARATGSGRDLDDPFGPFTTTDDDPADITVAPSADLGITKTDGDAVIRAVGDLFDYELTATNAGPSRATGVTITDELDERIRFVTTSDGCTAAGQTVTCPVGDLAAGATTSRHFTVEVVELPGPGAVIPNIASIHGNEPDPDCSDPTPDALCNHDDEETPQPDIDLGITKTDHDAVIEAAGDRYAYELVVTNAGPDDATEVTITDELDERIRFADGDERCTADGQVVTCPIGDLAASASTTLSFEVEVVALPEPGETIPNVATVVAAEPDPDCTEVTPDARCNHDDEETPRADDPEPPSTTTSTVPTTEPTTPKEPGSPPNPPTPSEPTDHGTIVRTGLGVRLLLGLAIATIGTGAAVLLIRHRRRHGYDFW